CGVGPHLPFLHQYVGNPVIGRPANETNMATEEKEVTGRCANSRMQAHASTPRRQPVECSFDQLQPNGQGVVTIPQARILCLRLKLHIFGTKSNGVVSIESA